MVNRTAISNGCVKSNTGYRRVVINTQGETRAVLYVVRSGLIPDRCTVQTCAEGDYIIGAELMKGEIKYSLCRIQKDFSQRVVLENTDVDNIVEYLPFAIIDIEGIRRFLERTSAGRSESFLPPTLGWDGVSSLGDINKAKRISDFFSYLDHKRVQKIVKAAMVSAREGLYTDWSRAEAMPAEFTTYKYSWDGCVVDKNTSEHWVLFYKDGNIKYCIFEPTDGEWGSNYAYTDKGVYSASPVPVSDDVVKAIKIRYGAYTRAEEHVTYGVAWTLYKK